MADLETLARDLGDRSKKLRDDSKGDDELLRAAYAPLLRAAADVAARLSKAELSTFVEGQVANLLDQALVSATRYPGAEGDEQAALVRRTIADLAQIPDELYDYGAAGTNDRAVRPVFAIARSASEQALVAVEVWVRTQRSVDQLEAAQADIERQAEAAEQARVLAQAAAAQSGTSALEAAFGQVAKLEGRRATQWRWATIVVLLTVIGVGVLYIGESTSGNAEWQGLAYRLAILSALAALAAYLARQSNHHRRLATWARSIEVQLKSFRAFVEPISDQRVQDGMYEIFGRRVLGSPPDGPAGSDDTTNLLQPLLDQVIRRAGN